MLSLRNLKERLAKPHGEASAVAPSIDTLQQHDSPARHRRRSRSRSRFRFKASTKSPSRPVSSPTLAGGSTNEPLFHLPTTGVTTPPAVNSPAPSVLDGGITTFPVSPSSVSTTPAQKPAPSPASTIRTPPPPVATVRIPAHPESADHDRPFGLKVLFEGRDPDVE